MRRNSSPAGRGATRSWLGGDVRRPCGFDSRGMHGSTCVWRCCVRFGKIVALSSRMKDLAQTSEPPVVISACLIARDEERVIGRCLDSIRSVCDEVCVIDTGSTDRTPQIARSLGAKVVRFIGCNDAKGRIVDFALARNKSLDLAGGSWVLWIDADEVLEPSSIPYICRHVSRDSASGVRVWLRSGGAHWPAVRLFRRANKHRFHGIVHEWVKVSGRICTDARIVIRNLPDKRGKESAAERDLRLCSRALEGNATDARMLLYMARALQKVGEYNRAIGFYFRYLEFERRSRAGRHFVMLNVAVCHLLSRRWGDAAAVAQRAVAIDERIAESHCVLGDAYLALAKYKAAERSYRRAIRCVPPPVSYPLFVNNYFYQGYPKRRLRFLAGR